MSSSLNSHRIFLRSPSFFITLACLIAIGSLLVAWTAMRAEDDRRRQMLNEARAVANALDSTRLASLDTPREIPEAAQYQRLRHELDCLVNNLSRCRFISIFVTQPDGALKFLLGSEDHDLRIASRREHLHGEIAAVGRQMAVRGAARASGMVHDHGESLHSAIVPLLSTTADAHSGVVAVGFAIDPEKHILAAIVMPPLLFTATAVLILLIGAAWIERRIRRDGKPAHEWRHLEHALSIIAIGALLSLTLYWIVRQDDLQKRQQVFWDLTSERVEAIDRLLRVVQNIKLEALARFFAASEYVSPEEFQNYTRFLLTDPLVESWQWIQPVMTTDHDTLYQIARIAPLDDRRSELGLDIRQERQRFAALEEARRTGLPTAAELPPHVRRDGQQIYAVYRPVFSDSGSEHLLGFAGAVLPLRAVLKNVQWNDTAALFLASARSGEQPRTLATTWDGQSSLRGNFSARQPVLAFGETFLVTAQASPAFDQLYPAYTGTLVLIAGLLLTTLLALLNGFFFQRRIRLEWLVEMRTAELVVAGHHTELAIRGADLGTWDWNARTGDIAMNVRWAEMLGLAGNELPRRVDEWPRLVDPDQQPAFRQAIADLGEGRRESYEAELRLKHRNGDPVWALVRGRTIARGPKGEPLRICGTCLDITPRILAETEREHLKDQLQQIQRIEAVGRLAGGIAHDLNNLLSPIIGYGQLLIEDLRDADHKRAYADAILRAGLRARDLVGQLLAYSRKQALEIKPVDINEIIAEFEPLLRRTIPEDIEIRIVPANHSSTILADSGQIEQVLMNLAVNAAQAMPDGGRLTIETARVELDQQDVQIYPDLQPGRYLVLAVSDTGTGLAQEIRDRIFEPFFSTKGDKGTGMGLATVYGIVKQHGGNIWLYSEPGQGTTFKVFLPTTDEAPRRAIGDQGSLVDLTGTETILLVEDNEDVRSLAGSVLARYGYTILSAASGQEALAKAQAQEGPIHLLLTDVVMPEMNGRELYRAMIQHFPQMAVLYMSGYTDDVIAHRGVLDEGVHFIQKPFSIESLAQRVREVIDS